MRFLKENFLKKKEEKVEFETAKVERKDVHTSITATGTIEPVTSVTVGTQVSGIVAHLYVDYTRWSRRDRLLPNWTRPT